MALSDIKPIEGGDFVNAAREIFNAAIKQLPVKLDLSPEGLLLLTLLGNEVISVDLSDQFPSRMDVAQAVSPGLASLLKAGLVQLADPASAEDLASDKKVLAAAGVVSIIQSYLKVAGGIGGKQNLQEITEEGNVTNKAIETAEYQTPLTGSVTDFIGMAVWQQIGQKRRLAQFDFDEFKRMINGQTSNIKAGFAENTCEQLIIYVYNILTPGVPATVNLMVDGKFKQAMTATATLPGKAAALGLPAETLIKAVWVVDNDVKDNKIHAYTLQHPISGEVLASASSPGNCSITNPQPKPKLVPVAQFREAPAPVTTPNQPPVLVEANKIQDQVITANGDFKLSAPANEFSDPENDAIEAETIGVDGLPDGVTFDKATGDTYYSGKIANGATFVLGRRWKDAYHAWQGPYWFKNTIARAVTAPLVVSEKIQGTIELREAGATGFWSIQQLMSDKSIQIRLTGFTVRWKTAYPNGAALSKPIGGVWAASILKDTLEKDEVLEMEAVITDTGKILPYEVKAINSDCLRPPGLNVYMLAWNFTPKGGSTRLFNSLKDANDTAGAYFDNTGPGTFNDPAMYIMANSISVGEPTYLGTKTDCTYAGDGIYPVMGADGKNTIKKAIRIQGGMIVDVLDSTYATPVVPVNSCAVLEEVAYIINAKGTGNQVDAVGFLYKGQAVSFRFSIQSTYDFSMELYSALTNDAVVSLSGNLARFNHRIAGSIASRTWRGDMAYKVRLEVYATGQPQTAPNMLKAIEFGVDMSQPVGVPITGFLCQ